MTARQLSLLTPAAEAPAPTALADAAARAAIVTDLHRNQLVEAGAGAGKTDRLVARIVALCTTADVPLSEIAAITFTEKAAAELRHRVHGAFVDAGRADLAAAVEQAAIGTLHAFARRVLQEFPIEAGLPPAFTVLDEVASDLAFAHRWTAFLDDLVRSDERVRLLPLGEMDGIRIDGWRQVAVAFGDNWDLVAERVSRERPPLEAVDVEALAGALDALVAVTHPPPDDTVAGQLGELTGWATQLRLLGAESPDGLDALKLLAEIAATKLPVRMGNKAKWNRAGGEAALEAFRAGFGAVVEQAQAVIVRLRRERRLLAGAELGAFTIDAAAQRRRLGELEFHDLLVLARTLVATHRDVRARLHARYTHVLLDEFQDTDPIQLELAVLITSDPDDPATAWVDRRPLPGRLFVVGDPKQSIYRFRRADIGQYLRARRHLRADVLTLSSNFRTVAPVVDWVNDVFGALIVGDEHVQPDYVPLDAARRAFSGPRHVVVLGEDAHPDEPDAEELRRREAREVAQAVRTAVADRWLIGDDEPKACTWGDIAILLPARTSLPILEDELLAAGVPYRTENSSLVYAADEIRALLLALRAIDDPTDELALVSTLRSALYGCSDVDLYRWYERGGRWSVSTPVPEPLDDDPVADALASLGALTARKHHETPAQLLQRLVEERRVLELALAGPGARDQWRRVRYVVDQARAWSEAGGSGLRNFVLWTARQAAEGRYVADVILPETDHDAVRVLTVHAAKGLEFPVVVVSGLSTRPAGERGVSVVWPEGTWDLRLAAGRSGEIYDEFKPLDEQMSHAERLRLLYVACTRARDHLVVSLHRADRGPKDPDRSTSAELLAGASRGAHHARPLVASTAAIPAPAAEAAELPWPDPVTWAAERDRALAAAARPAALGASRLRPPGPPPAPPGPDAGLRKDPVDLDLPPWQRGRYGTAIGRAVHAVLQAADLATGADIAALAHAQASAEGVISRTEIVERLARSALGTPIVRTVAAGAPHWRELYLAAPFGDLVIEGYIDVLVRTPAGLVVVDYKTDAAPDAGALAAKVAGYTDQLAAYGLLVEAVLGEPVVAGVLVFCGEDRATEVSVPGWTAALAGLAGRLAIGAVGPVDA